MLLIFIHMGGGLTLTIFLRFKWLLDILDFFNGYSGSVDLPRLELSLHKYEGEKYLFCLQMICFIKGLFQWEKIFFAEMLIFA